MNISLDDIKSKAPQGATHYDKSGDYWKVICDCESYFTEDGVKWIKYAFPCDVDIKNGFIKPL
jgi:hypothetical protein